MKNFFQLLMMKSIEFSELKAWLEKKQGKFVTHDVQNEILTTMSNSLLRILLKKVEGNIYSTMCDNYTDCSNHEQLTFCLRWVEVLKAHQTFLGFYEIPDIKSSTILALIKDVLTSYQLSMENFRGQCYDGASNMLGKTSRVAVELKNLQPKANYTHCHAHSFSLSVKDVTKKVKILGDIMGNLFIYVCMFIYLLILFNVEKTIVTNTNLYRQKKKKESMIMIIK